MFLFILAFFSGYFIDEACKERCLSGIKLTLSSKQHDSCEGPLNANECFLRSSLPDSMKGSVTRLIFKKRGDRKCLKN